MNAKEQRLHRTVTASLAASLEQVATVSAESIQTLDSVLGIHDGTLKAHAEKLQILRNLIDEERTHQLKLADEQRTYVDRGDKHTDAKVDSFLRRSFWQRLNWLLMGL